MDPVWISHEWQKWAILLISLSDVGECGLGVSVGAGPQFGA